AGDNKPDYRLPLRLFATDRFSSRRLNIYSKPDLLAFVRHVLRNTKEFDYIKASCFGKLFELPAQQCPVSCKLIHTLLTRQLICDGKHTLWSVFGADPLRFGLQEFGTITGLPCGAFPVGYDPSPENTNGPLKDSYWFKLIGKKKSTTITDLRSKLEKETNLPAHQQTPCPTPRYMEMLEDVDAFCSHPWGRESFLKTITCMKPPKFVPKKCEDPIGTLVQLLKQETYKLKGFPLALQLVAFRAIPLLQSQIEVPADTPAVSILELDEPHLPIFPALSKTDILRVEADPNLIPPYTAVMSDCKLLHKLQLKVTSLITIYSQSQPGWGIWHDVYDDPRLSFMEQLIADHQSFKKTQWPCGVTTEPIIIYPSPHDKHDGSKEMHNAPTGSSSNSNDEVLEMLSVLTNKIIVLEADTKRLHKLIKRRKTHTHSKQSSFHSLISRSKKSHKSDKACQTDDIPSNENYIPHLQHITTLLLLISIFYYNYVISQTLPIPHPHNIYPHTTRPHNHNPHIPIHTSPIHTSLIHTSPIHTSPIHTSHVHNSAIHPSPVFLRSSHTSPNRPAITISPSTTLQTAAAFTTPTLVDPPSTQPQSPDYDTSARQHLMVP
ncbi:hypothetical protein N665_0168s0019, partial [Sinapis alba]